MQAASNVHMDKARELERKGELENAHGRVPQGASSSRRATTQAAQRRTELERRLREKAEAERKPPRIDAMRERARRQTEGPILNPTSKVPLGINFAPTPRCRTSSSSSPTVTGINVIIEQGAQPVVTRPMTLNVSRA